jgi:Fe-S cluster assembly protein SufD
MALFEGRIRVRSTVDARIQKLLVKALEDGLQAYEARHPGSRGIVQGSAVVLGNADARILAMAGGRQVFRNQPARSSDLNRATESRRQPGSAMKPLAYLAAFRGGAGLDTEILDAPIAVPMGSGRPPKWINNYDGRFRGPIPLRLALAESRNAATIRLVTAVGIGEVVRTAHDLGIRSPLQPYVTTGLGASEVTLLEEFSSPDGSPSWFGGIVDLRAERGSRVRYASLQLLGDQAWRVSAQRVIVGPDAVVTTLNAEIGSKVTKLGLDVQMTGTGGTSRLLGLLAAGDDQRIDINSVQDLIGSHTTSDLLYLSALYDQAHAAFYGMTRVRAGAKQTSSYQECRNLLLSPGAGAEPIPVLEIETNDILRCGHGATAGAIDPTQMFYAQTRGLNADEAERMIVRGFFEQVVSKIEDETIRARVLDSLAGRIGRVEDEVAA